jgi:hypothetical protein
MIANIKQYKALANGGSNLYTNAYKIASLLQY